METTDHIGTQIIKRHVAGKALPDCLSNDTVRIAQSEFDFIIACRSRRQRAENRSRFF